MSFIKCVFQFLLQFCLVRGFFIPINIRRVIREMHVATHVCKPAFHWLKYIDTSANE